MFSRTKIKTAAICRPLIYCQWLIILIPSNKTSRLIKYLSLKNEHILCRYTYKQYSININIMQLILISIASPKIFQKKVIIRMNNSTCKLSSIFCDINYNIFTYIYIIYTYTSRNLIEAHNLCKRRFCTNMLHNILIMPNSLYYTVKWTLAKQERERGQVKHIMRGKINMQDGNRLRYIFW